MGIGTKGIKPVSCCEPCSPFNCHNKKINYAGKFLITSGTKSSTRVSYSTLGTVQNTFAVKWEKNIKNKVYIKLKKNTSPHYPVQNNVLVRGENWILSSEATWIINSGGKDKLAMTNKTH